MSDILLHHYPASPFSEKIRLVLGHKGLPWRSVLIPSIMPKPDVIALTGGYRRTPLLQIGCDVYCDTALICEVLDHLQPQPPLYPDAQRGLSRILAQWADSTLFWAAMGYTLQPKGFAAMFEGLPPEAAKAFGADRAAMGAGAPRLRVPDATAAYKSYLRRIATLLDGQDYLLGNAPCVADFSVYHPLWFSRRRVAVMAGILDATPAVLRWMDRMEAIGHGAMTRSTSAEAIAQCAAASGPAAPIDTVFQDEHGISLGSRVTVAAESFGPEPTEGELVAATRTRYTLRRHDERAGTVYVHFPRIGFVLRPAG